MPGVASLMAAYTLVANVNAGDAVLTQLQRLTSTQLATMPVRDGFRQRGEDMTRLETFTDAAFAFAVTLLVVGGGDAIPVNFDDMIVAMKQVPAFTVSFANIMVFWHAHHTWSRRFGLETSGSIFLSLLLVLVVLIYVYPLKAIYSGAIEFFSAGYFESYFSLSTSDDLRTMFVIFGAGYASLSCLIVLLNRHALTQQEQLALNELEKFDTVTAQQFWTISTIIPLISIVLAVVLPATMVVFAGLFYFAFGIAAPLFHRRRRPQRAALLHKKQEHRKDSSQ